jgi:hypothetical protein
LETIRKYGFSERWGTAQKKKKKKTIYIYTRTDSGFASLQHISANIFGAIWRDSGAVSAPKASKTSLEEDWPIYNKKLRKKKEKKKRRREDFEIESANS